MESSSLQFPQPLLGQINRLGLAAATDASAEHRSAKKFEILAVALANLSGGTSTTAVHTLNNPKGYVQTHGNPPAYFKQPFQVKNTSSVTAVADTRYDYVTTSSDFQTWVDFASIELGGGAFGNGMLQEETMTLEMPELANAAAIGFHTRDGNGKGPLQSNPTPLVITRARRTIALDHKLYADGWLSIPVKDLHADIIPLATNHEVNILSIAVPKLDGTSQQQTQPDTINDLFNTFMAGYSQAKSLTPTHQKTIINTGPIGTGDFKNSKPVVYVMQSLAAQQVGVDLRYWGLNATDQGTYDAVAHKNSFGIQDRRTEGRRRHPQSPARARAKEPGLTEGNHRAAPTPTPADADLGV